jgi:alpha-beta hydrolase superfamily lysophospholipase
MEPTKTQTIAGLYTETFLPASDPKGAVVVTHGYAEHCGRYREVAHVLVNAGWAVLTYDVRGHGHSPGPRGFIERFDIYLDDLTAMIAAGRALVSHSGAAARPASAGLAPGKPLVLLGHSHGSLITLRALASAHPPAVTSAIVSSPYLGLKLAVPGWKKVLARVASGIAPKLNQPSGLTADQLTSDVAMQKAHDADPLVFGTATTRWFTESSAAQQYVYDHADRIDVPTTWLVGAADPIADPAQSKRVADRTKGATYHDLVGLKHEVFNETDRASVFAKLVAALPSA